MGASAEIGPKRWRVTQHDYDGLSMRRLERITDLRTYPKRHVTPLQLAAYLNVSRQTIYHHIEKGALPVHRLGGLIRIRLRDALIYADEAPSDRRFA
jgi:excisionase family DNA binding protein